MYGWQTAHFVYNREGKGGVVDARRFSLRGEELVATCDGWETLSHESDEAGLVKIGTHTRLCGDCHKRFESDPMKAELLRFL